MSHHIDDDLLPYIQRSTSFSFSCSLSVKDFSYVHIFLSCYVLVSFLQHFLKIILNNQTT